jgi:hypothetical protein
MPLSTKEPPHLAEHKTLIKGTESRLFVLASAGLTMLMAGLCFKTVRRSITAHYALLVILCPSLLDGAPEAEPGYRLGNLGRILLVGRSAPAGMTGRNVLDAMPHAFPCSNISQCDYSPPLKLKASYLVERASDGGLRNPL